MDKYQFDYILISFIIVHNYIQKEYLNFLFTSISPPISGTKACGASARVRHTVFSIVIGLAKHYF